MEKYRVVLHIYEGKEGDLFKYSIYFNKSMVHTGRHEAMCYGMNEQVKKEKMSKIGYYLRRLYHSIIAKKQF